MNASTPMTRYILHIRHVFRYSHRHPVARDPAQKGIGVTFRRKRGKSGPMTAHHPPAMRLAAERLSASTSAPLNSSGTLPLMTPDFSCSL